MKEKEGEMKIGRLIIYFFKKELEKNSDCPIKSFHSDRSRFFPFSLFLFLNFCIFALFAFLLFLLLYTFRSVETSYFNSSL